MFKKGKEKHVKIRASAPLRKEQSIQLLNYTKKNNMQCLIIYHSNYANILFYIYQLKIIRLKNGNKKSPLPGQDYKDQSREITCDVSARTQQGPISGG